MKTFFSKMNFFKRLLVSYIIIVLLIFVFIVIITSNLISTISDYTEETALNSITRYQDSVERIVTTIEQLPSELTLDNKVVEILSQQQNLNAATRYKFVDVISKLRNYQFINPHIEGIFIYLPESNIIITGNSVYSFESWNELYMMDDSFLELINQNYNNKWLALNNDGIFTNDTIMLCTIPIGMDYVRSGTLGVIVNPCLSSSKIYSINYDYMNFYTLNDSNQILFTDSPKSLIEYNSLLSDFDYLPYGISKSDDYAIIKNGSDNFDMNHVMFSNIESFNKTLTASKIIVYISIGIILTFGLILSILMAYYNLAPIKKIASQIGGSQYDYKKPLSYIESSINDLMNINEQTKHDLDANKDLYLEGLFLKLLHHEILEESLVSEFMKKHEISLFSDYIQVGLLTLNANSSDTEEILEKINKAIKKEEVINKQIYILPGISQAKLIMLYDINTINTKSSEELVDTLIDETMFTDEYSIALSTVYKGLIHLGTAYEEAKQIYEYADFMGITGILTYNQFIQLNLSNDTSLIFESWFKKFNNFLLEQNLDGAKNMQNSIFEHLKYGNYSLQFIKCKLFSFVDKTIQIISNLNVALDDDIWDELNLSDRLINCRNIYELEKEYHYIFNKLSEKLLSSSSEATIYEKIVNITMSHYTDATFSVNYVAEQLGVTPSYISKMYKKSTGKKLVDYVQKIRIDKAKEIMEADPTLTISEIFPQCGFYNDITFIRVFKKHEGVTPGTYRDRY